MTRLSWGEDGSRLYETGIDRGVLYVGDAPGVPWNGLTGVSEAPTGAEMKPYYLDGVKYLTITSEEEFAATIEAFYSPPEFDVCDGTLSIGKGLFAKQQSRQTFGFSYRTRLGNDVYGVDHGYKIHLIYNALAAPSPKSYSTIGANVEAAPLSWSITATPELVNEAVYSAHLVIDSTEAEATTLENTENILYGTETTAPRLPTPDELITIFTSIAQLIVVDNGDGSWMATAPDEAITMLDAGTFQITWDSVINLDEDTFQISSL